MFSENNVKLKILTASKDFVPGEKIYLGFDFKIKDKWHIYWINPGETGLETKIDLILPKGFKLLQTFYPIPQKIVDYNIISFGYEKNALFVVEIETDSNIVLGNKYKIEGTISWLECYKKCIPGKKDFSIVFTAKEKSKNNRKIESYFTELSNQIHKNLDDNFKISARKNGENIDVLIESINSTLLNYSQLKDNDIYVFPVEQGYFDYRYQKISVNTNSIEIKLKLDEFKIGVPEHLKAVIVNNKYFDKEKRIKAIFINIPIN